MRLLAGHILCIPKGVLGGIGEFDLFAPTDATTNHKGTRTQICTCPSVGTSGCRAETWATERNREMREDSFIASRAVSGVGLLTS